MASVSDETVGPLPPDGTYITVNRCTQFVASALDDIRRAMGHVDYEDAPLYELLRDIDKQLMLALWIGRRHRD